MLIWNRVSLLVVCVCVYDVPRVRPTSYHSTNTHHQPSNQPSLPSRPLIVARRRQSDCVIRWCQADQFGLYRWII